MMDDMVRAAASSAQRSTNGWWRAECPSCPVTTGKSGGLTLGVRGSGTYHCFRCGISGRVRGGIPELGEDPIAEAAKLLAPQVEPPDGFVPLWREPGRSAGSLADARCYLRGRHLDTELWEAAGIGAVVDGYYGGRIVVPVEGDSGEWLGWVARDWTGYADRKYLYPRGMLRGSLLYQRAVLDEETDEPVMVVEGVFDALPYFGRVVAVLGKPSKQHVEMLAESKRPVAVCLDGDAWREAEALALQLRLRGVRAGSVRLPATRDPCDMAAALGAEWLYNQARLCVGKD